MKATDLLAYSVPAFFVLAMGAVMLSELAAEPYGIKLSGQQIDVGSRVISMLAPTVLRGLIYVAIVVGVVGLLAASFTKSGAAWLASVGVALGGKPAASSRRLD